MRAKVINEIRKSRIPYVKGGSKYEEMLRRVIELDKIIDETQMFGSAAHGLRTYWRWYQESIGFNRERDWDQLDYEELKEAYRQGMEYWDNAVLDFYLFHKLQLPERFMRKIKDDHFNIANRETNEGFTHLKPKSEEEIRKVVDEMLKGIDKTYEWIMRLPKFNITRKPMIIGSTYGFTFEYNEMQYSYYYDAHSRRYNFVEHQRNPIKVNKIREIKPDDLRKIASFSMKLPPISI